MRELLDPGVLGVFIPIIGIILGYRLISRNIELKKVEAEARLRGEHDGPVEDLRQEILALKEMLADIVLEGHVGRRDALPHHERVEDQGRDSKPV